MRWRVHAYWHRVLKSGSLYSSCGWWGRIVNLYRELAIVLRWLFTVTLNSKIERSWTLCLNTVHIRNSHSIIAAPGVPHLKYKEFVGRNHGIGEGVNCSFLLIHPNPLCLVISLSLAVQGHGIEYQHFCFISSWSNAVWYLATFVCWPNRGWPGQIYRGLTWIDFSS